MKWRKQWSVSSVYNRDVYVQTQPQKGMCQGLTWKEKDTQKTLLPILGNINLAVFTSVPTISLSFLCWKK